jgi:hypothetical protein
VDPIHKWPKSMNKESVVVTRIFILRILAFFFQAMKFLLLVSILISLSTVVYSAAKKESNYRIVNYVEAYKPLLNALRDAEVKALRSLEKENKFLDAGKMDMITIALSNLKSSKFEEFQKGLSEGLMVIDFLLGMMVDSPYLGISFHPEIYQTLAITDYNQIAPYHLKEIQSVVHQLNGIFPSSATNPVVSPSLSTRDVFFGATGLVAGILGMAGYVLLSSNKGATHSVTEAQKKKTHANKPNKKANKSHKSKSE